MDCERGAVVRPLAPAAAVLIEWMGTSDFSYARRRTAQLLKGLALRERDRRQGPMRHKRAAHMGRSLMKNIVFESVPSELSRGAQPKLLHDSDFVKLRCANRDVQRRSNLLGDTALGDQL